MIEDDYDWLEEFAESAGFIVNSDHTIDIPENVYLEELLETFANLVAEVAVNQFVTKMSDDVRGDATLH